MKESGLAAEAAAFCARKLLAEGLRPDMEEELALMEGMLEERGLVSPGREALRKTYMTELLRELLYVSNAVYGYPHKDRDLDRRVIPAFARVFCDLELPACLADAFDRHFKEGEAFPKPCEIEARLASGARRRPAPPIQEETGKITPGYGLECFERFKRRLKGAGQEGGV